MQAPKGAGKCEEGGCQSHRGLCAEEVALVEEELGGVVLADSIGLELAWGLVLILCCRLGIGNRGLHCSREGALEVAALEGPAWQNSKFRPVRLDAFVTSLGRSKPQRVAVCLGDERGLAAAAAAAAAASATAAAAAGTAATAAATGAGTREHAGVHVGGDVGRRDEAADDLGGDADIRRGALRGLVGAHVDLIGCPLALHLGLHIVGQGREGSRRARRLGAERPRGGRGPEDVDAEGAEDSKQSAERQERKRAVACCARAARVRDWWKLGPGIGVEELLWLQVSPARARSASEARVLGSWRSLVRHAWPRARIPGARQRKGGALSGTAAVWRLYAARRRQLRAAQVRRLRAAHVRLAATARRRDGRAGAPVRPARVETTRKASARFSRPGGGVIVDGHPVPPREKGLSLPAMCRGQTQVEAGSGGRGFLFVHFRARVAPRRVGRGGILPFYLRPWSYKN